MRLYKRIFQTELIIFRVNIQGFPNFFYWQKYFILCFYCPYDLFVQMIVGLLLMFCMIMVMRTVVSGMLMVMISLLTFMGVWVAMFMSMSMVMSVLMIMTVHLVTMFVRVLMDMGMFVLVLMFVFMITFHCPSFFH
jgi:hypothetical protein